MRSAPESGRSLALRLLASLLFLSGFLFMAAGARAQISPGALSKAHQSLNGSTQCNTCHQFGASTPTFKCLECHKEIADRLAAHKGYHALLGMKNPERPGLRAVPPRAQWRGFFAGSLGAVAQAI